MAKGTKKTQVARRERSDITTLSKLAAAIREFVTAWKLGEDKERLTSLQLHVAELCMAARKISRVHVITSPDGHSLRVARDYRNLLATWFDPDGCRTGSKIRGRRRPNEPTELDLELDRVEEELAQAQFERGSGKRCTDDRGRPLPAPAVDRLLAIAKRIGTPADAIGQAHADNIEPERRPVPKLGGWTRAELVQQADEVVGGFSGSTFDRIRKAAGVSSSERGGKGQQRRISPAELERMILAAKTGPFRKGDLIADAWQRLLRV